MLLYEVLNITRAELELLLELKLDWTGVSGRDHFPVTLYVSNEATVDDILDALAAQLELPAETGPLRCVCANTSVCALCVHHKSCNTLMRRSLGAAGSSPLNAFTIFRLLIRSHQHLEDTRETNYVAADLEFKTLVAEVSPLCKAYWPAVLLGVWMERQRERYSLL